MEKEFVPYELALRMKQLKSMDKGFRCGFNEKTFAYFVEGFPNDKLIISNKPKLYSYEYNGGGPELISAPLYQQAFRWFREKYNLTMYICNWENKLELWDYNIHTLVSTKDYNIDYDSSFHELFYETYEEAELECLKKLLEIVEQKKN